MAASRDSFFMRENSFLFQSGFKIMLKNGFFDFYYVTEISQSDEGKEKYI